MHTNILYFYGIHFRALIWLPIIKYQQNAQYCYIYIYKITLDFTLTLDSVTYS